MINIIIIGFACISLAAFVASDNSKNTNEKETEQILKEEHIE